MLKLVLLVYYVTTCTLIFFYLLMPNGEYRRNKQTQNGNKVKRLTDSLCSISYWGILLGKLIIDRGDCDHSILRVKITGLQNFTD